MPRSLYSRLLLAFFVVVAVGIVVAEVVAEESASREFRSFVNAGDAAYLDDLAGQLGARYEEVGPWEGTQSFLDSLPLSGRLRVEDSTGAVVAESTRGRGAVGQGAAGRGPDPAVAASGVTRSAPIVVGGVQIGKLVAFGGPGAQRPNDYLERIRLALVAGGAVALALALILGLVFARSLSRPLSRLSIGARALAAGDLGERVPPRGPQEIVDLATAFNAMAQELEDNQRQRRRFLADIVHELRTPLAIIQGTSQGFIDGVIPADPEHATVVRDEAEVLSRIVTDLRDLSLAEVGELRLERKPVDLGDVARATVAAFAERASAQRLDLRAVVSDVPVVVFGDRERLLQVFANLVDNALRHTGEGGSVTLAVGLSGHQAVAEVKDTGEGIPADHLPHLFDRFYRVDPARRRTGGTGLGLAIVRVLAEAQQATVTVQSRPGEGTTFQLLFPSLSVAD